MKQTKWISLLIAGMMAIVLLSGCSSKETLHLYSWADNFDEAVLADFEEEFDIKVTYDVFANNEDLLAKIKAGGGGYDLIQPSDYMVETMIKNNLLEPLDKNNIPNFNNIADTFKDPTFDPGNQYSIVYTSGVTGIAYNKKYIKDSIDSWDDLWNPEYEGKVLLLDDNREVIGMALKKNGYSNSSTNETEIKTAVDDLKALLPSVLAFDTDTIKQKMIQEEGWIGTVWSGDAAYIVNDNPDIAYVVPKEGATMFSDNYAIPKGAKNKALAEKFINYMLDPEVSAKNYETIGYSDPNTKAMEYHSETYRNNTMINLSEDELSRTEWLSDVGDTLQVYDRFWTELKSGRE
ncbi:spermidine/putrescine ABC transporter substrate-binding protein [Paenibacillus crassostreae]|uniref:Spermidine/putrescine ABC transporter substrate-binding protein n=2 Tax=Paenibacillus crassostreae TaxID=1763538 RepID=A0A167GE58_9BACL|nr:spermidine/putrescine ABC transporter substrate-binding protein [Paenibacillus crassostreae]AOZ92714.1 spermidine/putrescine ABC transporter substrate-binding protein [Paenibacillus crassostreae]OAB77486.1 spermidine/putrescine ABC transporter substrate-binding protein [Paenibacillus crassostreae]